MGTFQDFFVALSGIYSQLSFLFYFQKIYILNCKQGIGWLMVFNAAINNISAISRRSDLLMEETGLLEENHRPVASH
jgi:hypothetical protein